MLTGSEVLKEAENDIHVDEAKDEVEVQRTKTIHNVSDSNEEQEEDDEDSEVLTPHP